MNPATFLARFDALDRALVAKGFPATSPWWRETLGRFYSSRRRQLVARVGRRGGKSSTLCRVAVLEALYGEHTIPPGDVGIVGFVSVSRDEASQRIRTIKAIFDALGVAYKPIDGGVELAERPIVSKVFTGTVAGVSGGTWICAFVDEVAKLRDSETGTNPATEVLASLRPTMATQPNAKIFLSSSPLGKEDAHAVAFDQGETEFQCVAYAPTWEANPTVTEAATHALEPDPKLWSREYKAIPGAAVSTALNRDEVMACLRPFPFGHPMGHASLLTDSSAGRGDRWAHMLCCWWQPTADPNGVETFIADDGLEVIKVDQYGIPVRLVVPGPMRPTLLIRDVGVQDGRFAEEGISTDSIIRRHARLAHESQASHVIGDKYQEFFLTSAYAKHRLAYLPQIWSVESKTSALVRLRQLLRDRALVIEDTDEGRELAKELCALQETIRPSGVISLGGRRGTHDDRASALLSGLMADADGSLLGSVRRRAGQFSQVPSGRRFADVEEGEAA